jgi:hypothetical protein
MLGPVRHSELWRRLEHHLGPAYARTWAGDQVLRALGGRTVLQALADGDDASAVWRAVHATLELPARER